MPSTSIQFDPLSSLGGNFIKTLAEESATAFMCKCLPLSTEFLLDYTEILGSQSSVNWTVVKVYFFWVHGLCRLFTVFANTASSLSSSEGGQWILLSLDAFDVDLIAPRGCCGSIRLDSGIPNSITLLLRLMRPKINSDLFLALEESFDFFSLHMPRLARITNLANYPVFTDQCRQIEFIQNTFFCFILLTIAELQWSERVGGIANNEDGRKWATIQFGGLFIMQTDCQAGQARSSLPRNERAHFLTIHLRSSSNVKRKAANGAAQAQGRQVTGEVCKAVSRTGVYNTRAAIPVSNSRLRFNTQFL